MDGMSPDLVIVDEEWHQTPDGVFHLQGGTVYTKDPRKWHGYDSTLESVYRCKCPHPESYHTDEGRCMTIECMSKEACGRA